MAVKLVELTAASTEPKLAVDWAEYLAVDLVDKTAVRWAARKVEKMVAHWVVLKGDPWAEKLVVMKAAAMGK